MGYHMAGFTEIVGVDICPMPKYPFAFVQSDALDYLAKHGAEFDAIHASPPCQGYSIMRNLPWHRDKEYPLLIEPTRELLLTSGKPYVMENVMGAHLPAGYLCGMMFGLGFYNHRAFETPFMWMQPGHPRHDIVFKSGHQFGNNGGRRNIVSRRFGCEWMDRDGRSNAIPPAYTEYIGQHLIAAVREHINA